MALENGGVITTMPVSPTGGNLFGGFGGDNSLILLFFLFMMCGGFGGGFGGFGGDGIYPWLNNSQNINGGFRDQMLNSSVSGIQSGVTSGFGDVQTALCGGFAGVNASISNGFANAESSANARQMADMNQAFASQNAMSQGFNALQNQMSQCCCDQRLATCQTQNIVQNEGAATRLAIQNQTQAILDKMCQDKIDAKNERIADLERQLTLANLQASQVAQTSRLIADNTMQTQYIVNRVAPYPIPSYTVANPVTPVA